MKIRWLPKLNASVFLALREWGGKLTPNFIKPHFLRVCTLFFLVFAAQANTPPGTVISNTASSAQQVSGTPQSTSSNAVSVTVAVSAPPSLSKVFSAASINAGAAANLVFTVSNNIGNPAQTGIAFTDTLPAGLQLTSAAAATIAGAGCSGTVNLLAPGTIAVSGMSMSAGTATCTISVNGVTNAPGQSNDTCTGNPPAFTNGSGNITGLINLTNAVTNQCLVVKVLVFDSIVPRCIRDTPYVDYTVHAVGVAAPSGVAISWQKLDGTVVQTLNNQALSGRLLWPGAAVDASGNPTAWPGWLFSNGVWVQINDGLRPDMRLVFTINPTSDIVVSYPPATPTCNAEPPQLTLRGATVSAVDPGGVASFLNVLGNASSRIDTFNIALSGSNYPAGTVFKLFREDGVTPLSDTNADGIPDSGPVAPGSTFKFVVKATLPIGVAGGPYSVMASAQSLADATVKAADGDVLSTLNPVCRVLWEPDNNGSVAPGGSVVYSHVLTNVGVCNEAISFPANFLANSAAGWSSQLFNDNPVAGGASIVGTLDPADTQITAASTFTLAAGARAVLLARVTAPAGAASGARNDVDVRLNAGSSGLLAVRDGTTVGTASNVSNAILGYVDNAFQRPTVWAFIGQDLFLRANAASCNQDPLAVESRIIVITGPNGEREEIVARETGVNSGIFQTTGLPVRRQTVVAGDVILEGAPYDTFDVELTGCGQKISTTVTVVDPTGVVFDSRNNQPVASAIVRLVGAVGSVCGTTPATVQKLVNGQFAPAANPITTGNDGRFDFPLVSPGDYCVQVQTPNGYTWISTLTPAQLPAGRNVLATAPNATSGGSYGGAFTVGPTTGPVIVDVPVDSGTVSGLFVQKTALRQTVEIGELNDYTVTVNNSTGKALDQASVLLTDDLPAGFTYVAGSARIDGKSIADPAGKAGPRLVFDIGPVAKDQQRKFSYRVRVGPGAMQGDGINRVFASYRASGSGAVYTESNLASAKVTVVGGVFSDRAFVIGKVYADCNVNGIQDAGEVGVPGVRLYLEDGTNVISDSEGKFSLYGLSPRTHVLKIDRSTLPAGIGVADLLELSNRNLGKADSRILDLQNGELHKADFAIKTCSDTVMAEVQARRKASISLRTEIDGRLQQAFSTDPNSRAVADVKALAASGVVGEGAAASTANATLAGKPAASATERLAVTDGATGFRTLVPLPETRAKPIIDSPAVEPAIPLENLLPDEDNTLGFMGLKEGDVLPYAQSTIRVKGMAGANFKLVVNGNEIGGNRVGKRAVLAEKKLQAWEYIGIDLLAGRNVLTLTQSDQFGNVRGEKTIAVMAPGKLGRILVSVLPGSRGEAIADGKSPIKVMVRLADDREVPVTSRTAITLSTNLGRWDVEDLNPAEPGIQTFINGGKGEFTLLPPTEPAQALVSAMSGDVKGEARIDFLPDLRELLAAGVIEGVLNLRKLDSRALVPTRQQDGFEQEITHLSRTWNNGKYDAAARAAMFIKGKVKGEYLLTLAYDSDKNTRERLFRDIQPDEFYPVYGDSSVRGFDAQSTGRFYVRVDKKKSYLLYGDYNTSTQSEARKLANYNRSLTGIKQHYENTHLSANLFASRDSTRQIIEEFRANGTSGPFTLANAKGLVNSEKIELLTRDRNQSSMIIKSVLQARFVDYELEPLTGRILFKSPIASLDESLNPVSVRITYEIDQGGQEFWVTGADAQFKVNDRLEVGGIAVDDQNPLDKFRMLGVNAVAKLADKTFLIAEVAQTERNRVGAASASGTGVAGILAEGEKRGMAERVEFKHQDGELGVNAFAGRADQKFDNPSSSLSSGRVEAGAKMSYKLDEKTRLRGEVLRTEDTAIGGRRDGVLVTAERTLEAGLRLEVGLRHARDTKAPASIASGPVPNEVTAVRVRLSGDVPDVKGATAYTEVEIDPNDSGRKTVAVGGDYKLPGNGRLYARHEFISSLSGPYGLNGDQRQNSTVFGINTDYMKDGNAFSEYRVRDAISGGDAEAALGLRNLWTVAEGVKLSTGFEKVHALSGSGNSEATAMTFGLEYTANPLWKGSTRLELREGTSADSVLSTVAAAVKVNRDWTFLGRNTYSLIRNKGAQAGENERDRMQLGLAYRDTETDVWNGLGRIEHRIENDTTQPGIELKRTIELLSIHANWQPRRPFTFTGRYAAKWTREYSNALESRNGAQLFGLRATWEFAPRWDLSVQTSALVSRGARSKYYGSGVEVGYMVMENLWLSAGYNFFGFRDDDLTTGEYTNKGAFIRMRYKFDEDLFASRSARPAPSAGLVEPAGSGQTAEKRE